MLSACSAVVMYFQAFHCALSTSLRPFRALLDLDVCLKVIESTVTERPRPLGRGLHEGLALGSEDRAGPQPHTTPLVCLCVLFPSIFPTSYLPLLHHTCISLGLVGRD